MNICRGLSLSSLASSLALTIGCSSSSLPESTPEVRPTGGPAPDVAEPRDGSGSPLSTRVIVPCYAIDAPAGLDQSSDDPAGVEIAAHGVKLATAYVVTSLEGDVVHLQDADAALKLSEGSAVTDAFASLKSPRTASVRQNAALLAYLAARDGGPTMPYVQLMNTGEWGDEFALSSDGRNSTQLALTALDDSYAVAWVSQSSPPLVETRLLYAVVNQDGSLRVEPAEVTLEDAVAHVLFASKGFSLKGESFGNALVYTTVSESDYAVWHRVIDPETGKLADSHAITSDLPLTGRPTAARVSSDATLVAFTQLVEGIRSEVHLRQIKDDGTLLDDWMLIEKGPQHSPTLVSLYGLGILGYYAVLERGRLQLRLSMRTPRGDAFGSPAVPPAHLADLQASDANSPLSAITREGALGYVWKQDLTVSRRLFARCME